MTPEVMWRVLRQQKGHCLEVWIHSIQFENFQFENFQFSDISMFPDDWSIMSHLTK